MRTPPCWFSSKQQAVVLLEADVPPGEAQPREPQGGPEDRESSRKKRVTRGAKRWVISSTLPNLISVHDCPTA